MLPEAPCIKYLVGCSESYGASSSNSDTTPLLFQNLGDGNGSSSSSESTPLLFQNLGNRSSSSRSTTSSVSASDASSVLGSGLPGALRTTAASAAERLAVYVVAAKNKGTSALQGTTFTHGPLPTGAVFDPTRSSQGCNVSGNSVVCTLDALPGEQKDITLAYHVSSAISCALSRVLQKVKAESSQVSTSVSCRMEKAKDVASVAGQTQGVQVGDQQTGGISPDGLPVILEKPLETSYKTGYKPFSGVLPRTGSDTHYYLSTANSSSLSVVRQSSVTLMDHSLIITASIVLFLSLIWTVKRSNILMQKG